MDIKNYLNYIISHISNSYSEDVGDGDHTSIACIDKQATGKAKLLVKEDGIIAGVEVAKLIITSLAKNLSIDILVKDGTQVKKGDVVFTLSGSSIEILTLERLILNYMQRMSGIATTTNAYVKKIEGYKAKILDTRKTSPGLRVFEKWAVEIGGAINHRYGLYDMIMIKDNHIDYAGGIENAIQKTHRYLAEKNKKLPIEIEVRNFKELEQVLKVGDINRIMLDNFSVNDTLKAVQIINQQYETEASGGITIENVKEYAASGVDYISIGALTHYIKSLDLSLKAIR